ncbi:MAG: methyltransferase [Nanoarchaeota archaeon]|nr:methyltransferase [Nanoarchaeota archaeon]MBU1027425.1 methyltransferase [Nanoarchaeota archaeon]
MSEIYSPEEDSYLLSRVVSDYCKENKIEKVIDIGSGLGIQAQTCIYNGVDPKNITLADINKDAVNYLKSKFPKSQIIQSNLFSNIKDKYDFIIFNPPYLPESKHDKEPDTTGGKKGDELIIRFLKQLRSHLASKGRALLLLSSLTPMVNVNNYFKTYKTKLIAKKKLFFEELYVWELGCRFT